MGLSEFIRENKQAIIADWVNFARDNIPPAKYMNPVNLRDHIEAILNFVADDLDSAQTKQEQRQKSEGLAIKAEGGDTTAETHGELRFIEGFNATEIMAEFRALRASVTRQWENARTKTDMDYKEIVRFNEAIDQVFSDMLVYYLIDFCFTQDRIDSNHEFFFQ